MHPLSENFLPSQADGPKARESAVRRMLGSIVNSSGDAIISKTLKGIITSWNPAAEGLFGYAAEEIIGQPITVLIPPDRLPEEKEILERIGRGERIQHFETVRLRKDGTAVDVSVTISPIRDEEGRVIGASKILRDFTEKKAAEVALRDSETRMRLATETTGVGIWEWNVSTGQIRWDAQMFRIYGIEPTADGFVDYSDWSGGVVPEDLSRNEEILQDTVRRCGRSQREFRIRRRDDGQCRSIEALETVRINAKGLAEWVVGTNLDITKRKEAEAKLREREESFRTMANSISQLAWIAQPDGFIFWYNQRWYDYTGTTPEQMEGWGWQSVHDPQVLPRVMAKWTGAIAAGQPFDMEFPLRGADGKFRRFLTRAVPLKDAAGQVMQWFGTNTDVDELKRAQDQVLWLNTELEHRVTDRTAQLAAANKELEAFSYSVSHDLRAPLRAVDGYARMVVEDYADKLDSEGQRMLDTIRSESQRMGRLIDDLLAFSRVGRQEIRIAPIDMTALARSVFEQIAALYPDRKLHLDLHPLPEAQGELSMMRQVWVNLISNAVKFTQNREDAEIEIGGSSEGNGELHYFVRDNGAGFDMRFAGKLFGVFQRLHSEAEFEGTGVGLALVQRIVHRHGGRVWAKGEINQGAAIHFALPVKKL